ncbi:hydroxymethylglutaryl-CoA lyase [Peribacillus kribbensis]|uniref:hydroxymethylglutaryl-CoA lyase n=1 Tax=Peribacillus kribbensis TaxID=356658 RepID=UPI00041367DF|nr:hydroxymethylglutaryl-CoA lyase [Peribacillus kribbensis]
MNLPKKAEIIEVGPRDGLQNESEFIPTDHKIALINALNKTGIKRMEATSFVHPAYVPQMKDAKEVLQGIVQDPNIQYMALLPNEKGFDRAVEQGVQAVSLVVGASNSFNLKNVKMTREESINQLEKVVLKARAQNMFVRYNIATAFWCPFEGMVDDKLVLDMVKKINRLDVDEIVLCDTIGRANPKQVYSLFKSILEIQPDAMITGHFHDTYGMGQANVLAALQSGVTRFDASIGGLGGCPFAPGAAGNVATEDVVFMMNELGIETGIDMEALRFSLNLVREMSNRNLMSHYNMILEHSCV